MSKTRWPGLRREDQEHPVDLGQNRAKMGAGKSDVAENTLCHPCILILPEMDGKASGLTSSERLSIRHRLKSRGHRTCTTQPREQVGNPLTNWLLPGTSKVII